MPVESFVGRSGQDWSLLGAHHSQEGRGQSLFMTISILDIVMKSGTIMTQSTSTIGHLRSSNFTQNR
ncbi:hypothetical protein ABH908_002265 [Pseudomonas frederiksbergensis]|jgi:hypothetical protein